MNLPALWLWMAIILGERKENVLCSDDSGTLLVAYMCLREKCCCEVAHISIHSIIWRKNYFQWKCIKEVHRHPFLDSSLSCSCRMRSKTSRTSGTSILRDLKSMKYWKQQTSLLSLSLSIMETIRWLIEVVFLLFLLALCHLRKFWFSYYNVSLTDCNTSTSGLYYMPFFPFFFF